MAEEDQIQQMFINAFERVRHFPRPKMRKEILNNIVETAKHLLQSPCEEKKGEDDNGNNA